MALGAIEANRTRPFDSGGAGSKELYGLGAIEGNRTYPSDSGGKELHGLGAIV